MLIIGSDSHTPHAGRHRAVAFGVGTTAIFNSWITKDVRVRVPKSFKVVITGTPRPNVTAKDYMLEILRHPYVRDGHAIGQIIEYAGPAVEALSVDERATMTNMAAEVGAFTGIVAADEKSVEFLVSERGMDRGRAEALVRRDAVDPDAEYVKVIEIDASTIHPMAALPNDPGNGVTSPSSRRSRSASTSPTRARAPPGRRTTWTCTRRSSGGRGAGTPGPPGRALLHPVREHRGPGVLPEKGYLDLFERMGAEFIEPGCGACINAGPGVTATPRTRSPSPRRTGTSRAAPGPGQLYLGSPYSVAASAVAGYVTDQVAPGRAPRGWPVQRRR
jgi:3-isopropylmalate/(R)-2-methylmalate dehydratase large subunit